MVIAPLRSFREGGHGYEELFAVLSHIVAEGGTGIGGGGWSGASDHLNRGGGELGLFARGGDKERCHQQEHGPGGVGEAAAEGGIEKEVPERRGRLGIDTLEDAGIKTGGRLGRVLDAEGAEKVGVKAHPAEFGFALRTGTQMLSDGLPVSGEETSLEDRFQMRTDWFVHTMPR
jgi:hypothetical protein